MKKKIAIPTENGKLSNGISMDTMINIFEIENDKVIQVEQEKLKNINHGYTSLWFACKKITELYIDGIALELKNKLTQLGIIVKHRGELSNNAFFNQFVFD